MLVLLFVLGLLLPPPLGTFCLWLLLGLLARRAIVGMCRTGSGFVREWGPDCYVSGSLVWGGGTTWCGVFGNSQAGAQPGTNFYLYPFSLPGSRKGGSLRLMLAADGSATVAAWY